MNIVGVGKVLRRGCGARRRVPNGNPPRSADSPRARFSGRMARAVAERRDIKPFERTADLAEVLKVANPAWEKGKNPATRAFQGLRIHVNNELGDLEAGLEAALDCLEIGGRLVLRGEPIEVVFTSGGTESIFQSLLAARQWARATKPEITEPEFVAPQSAHPCVGFAPDTGHTARCIDIVAAADHEIAVGNIG